jgi:DNA polymerase III sliding clamp (beta) subunit (PCNA family)
MKFTIRIDELESLLKAVASRPRKTDTITLSACAARVFVECKDAVGGIEALVFSDGAITLPARKFRELVKTYKGRTSLTFEGSGDGLRIENFSMSVLAYDPDPKAPAAFQVFPARPTNTQGGPSRIE